MESGFTHGYLTVLNRSEPPINKHGQSLWDTQCICGVVKPMRTDHIQRLQSCGCKRDELSAKANRTHGCASNYVCTPEYKAWQEMKGRCSNQNNKRYHRYGGRGIMVCAAWLNDFQAFYDHIGPRPKQPQGRRLYSLDRIDPDGNYEPGNVRWATAKVQANNKGSKAPRERREGA